MIEQYRQHLEDAYRIFYNDHWPCGYRDPKGRKCVNVSTKHQKGHQTAEGKVFSAGGYTNTVNPEGPLVGAKRFVNAVKGLYEQHIKEIKAEVNPGPSRLSIDHDSIIDQDKASDSKHARASAASLRRKILSNANLGFQEPVQRRNSRVRVPGSFASFPREVRFLSDSGRSAAGPVAAQFSHTTCFACLFSTPRHVLGCGHLICETCVDDFSNARDSAGPISSQKSIQISCPFCSAEWSLKRDPRHTACRVLCLDG